MMSSNPTRKNPRSAPALEYFSDEEAQAYQEQARMLKQSSIPDTEILAQLPLFLNRPLTVTFQRNTDNFDY
jgi:hypothetical protein